MPRKKKQNKQEKQEPRVELNTRGKCAGCGSTTEMCSFNITPEQEAQGYRGYCAMCTHMNC
jgi:hypothetical protein